MHDTASATVSSLGLSETVKQSWDRSRRYGISPTDNLLLNQVSSAQQQGVKERSRHLAAIASFELNGLQRSFAGAGWVMACLDEEGTIIEAIGNTTGSSKRLRAVMRTGVSLSENLIGTNGPGCALADKKPVVVSGNEHYLQEAKEFVCAAVPVFDPAGHLVGALDATCDTHRDASVVVDALALAGRAVENQLVYNIRNAIFIRVHPRSDMLCTPLEGLLALSEDGQLLGLNQTARRILSLAHEDDLQTAFDTLFETPFSQIIDRLRGARQAPVQFHSNDGLLLYARVSHHSELGRDKLGMVTSVPGAKLTNTPRMVNADTRVERKIENAQRAYGRNIPILLTGETGTGKEVVARRLHESGRRAMGPFIAINCSSIPSGLIESEFFGYVDGAFTGGRRGGAQGKIEQADQGTLFLDEIGDMPYELQGRLLRVLQERSITRVGGSKSISVDIALICATHRDLHRLVAQGEFREDLFYRINGFNVNLPALRERDDIRDLILHILAEANEGRIVPRLSEAALSVLIRYTWPGNIRQLHHVLRMASVFAEETGCINLDHLPEEITNQGMHIADALLSPDTSSLSKLKSTELNLIQKTLLATGGNVSAAALAIGTTRQTLHRKIRQYGIEIIARE